MKLMLPNIIIIMMYMPLPSHLIFLHLHIVISHPLRTHFAKC